MDHDGRDDRSPPHTTQYTLHLPLHGTAVGAAFAVPLVSGYDEEVGGAFYEHASNDAAVGPISGLLVRPNALDAWTRLLPGHEDVAFLVDVTLRTRNLLDLGRMASALERRGPFDVLAYRVVGDLVRDRVPRVLTREFSPLEVAARRRGMATGPAA